jgi:hypothetical protein
VLPEGGDHGAEIGLVTQFRVQMPMVHDVVAMTAARPGLQVGRGIDMADAEPREVGRQRRGISEAEAFVELQAVGGARDRRWP